MRGSSKRARPDHSNGRDSSRGPPGRGARDHGPPSGRWDVGHGNGPQWDRYDGWDGYNGPEDQWGHGGYKDDGYYGDDGGYYGNDGGYQDVGYYGDDGGYQDGGYYGDDGGYYHGGDNYGGGWDEGWGYTCLLYTSPSPRDS